LTAATLAFHGSAAVALHRHLTGTASATLLSESVTTSATAAAGLGLLPTAALLLRLLAAAMTAAGLRSRRSGNCQGRNAGRQDELPHLKSPHRSGCKRSCFRAVPPVSSGERFSEPVLSLTFQRLAGQVQILACAWGSCGRRLECGDEPSVQASSIQS
jgi:hypothetical protein